MGCLLLIALIALFYFSIYFSGKQDKKLDEFLKMEERAGRFYVWRGDKIVLRD